MYFIGDKVGANNFKASIKPSLKETEGLKLAQEGALNHIREKVKPWCKISYKLSKEEYGYDPLLDISSCQTFIQLKDYLDRIHHCIKVVGTRIFYGDYPFALLSWKKICTSVAFMTMKQKEWMVTKDYWKQLYFSQKRILKMPFRSENS